MPMASWMTTTPGLGPGLGPGLETGSVTADEEPLRLRRAVPDPEPAPDGAPDAPLRLRRAVPAGEGEEAAPPIEVRTGPPSPSDPAPRPDPGRRPGAGDPAGWADALREARGAAATAWVVAPPDGPRAGAPDPERVRALAADIGRPGVPVSLRAPVD